MNSPNIDETKAALDAADAAEAPVIKPEEMTDEVMLFAKRVAKALGPLKGVTLAPQHMLTLARMNRRQRRGAVTRVQRATKVASKRGSPLNEIELSLLIEGT